MQIPFQMHQCVSFLWEIISRHGVKPDPHKRFVLSETSLPKFKKELQSFMGIMNYLSKYSPATTKCASPCIS